MSPSHNLPRGLDLDIGRYIEVDAAISMELIRVGIFFCNVISSLTSP